MPRQSPLGIEGTGLSWRDPDASGRPTVAMVRARDEQGAWQCKRFQVTSWHRDDSPIVPDAAKEWARTTRKSFVREEAVATASTFQEFAALLVENLQAAGVTEGRLAIIRAVAAGLAAEGIADMRTDAFPARVRSWLTSLKVGWSLAEDAKNRRKTCPSLSPATRNKLLIICRQVTGLAVMKRRLSHDPLGELPRFKESVHLKPLFSIADLRQMVGDGARDHASTDRTELERAIGVKAQGGMGRTDAMKAIAQDRGCHWSTLYNILARKPEADPWWLACCLMVYTGCRAAEAMHLRWEWIKWDARVITLKLASDYASKSDQERLIPLEPELHDILLPRMKTFGHILPPEIRAGGSGARIRKSADKGEGTQDYTAAFTRYLHRVGMDIGDKSCHSLRHCYITMKLARADTNVERLRKAVGHADFSTTMGYGKMSQYYEAEVDRWSDSTLWLRREETAMDRTSYKQ